MNDNRSEFLKECDRRIANGQKAIPSGLGDDFDDYANCLRYAGSGTMSGMNRDMYEKAMKRLSFVDKIRVMLSWRNDCR